MILEIEPKPLMNLNEIEALHRLIEDRQPGRVLEWGGGGSTLYWPAAYQNIEWVTIEHNPSWAADLRGQIRAGVTLLELQPPDLYTISPMAIGQFDLIIVDCPRWRVECLGQARNLLRPGGVVVLHDAVVKKWRPGWAYYSQPTWLARPPTESKYRGLVMFDKPRPTKIFGVGLSKTGTVSLTAALTRLGFKTKHFPPAMDVIRLAEKYDGLTDSSLCNYLEVLDRLHPGSKFILTIRAIEDWLDSCQRHWAGRTPRTPGWDWNRRAVYGMTGFDKQVFRRVYDGHNQRVLDYFAGREDKLLIVDIPAGDGYEALCPFLNLPALDEPFPRLNQRGRA